MLLQHRAGQQCNHSELPPEFVLGLGFWRSAERRAGLTGEALRSAARLCLGCEEVPDGPDASLKLLTRRK